MLANLQALRALAALGVVFYHTDHRLFDGIHTDLNGVSIFFVISGFIMCYVTRNDPSRFFEKRLIRIVPLYWFATATVVVLNTYGLTNPVVTLPAMFGNGLSSLQSWIVGCSRAFLDGELWLRVLKSLFFIPLPPGEYPVIGVGWTLNLEMFFYFVFGVALLVTRTWAPVAACAVLLAMKSEAVAAACGPVCAFYAHDYTYFFVLGVGLYYVWTCTEGLNAAHRGWVGPMAGAVLAGALLATVAAESPAVRGIAGPVLPHAHYLLPVLVVLSALLLERVGLGTRSRLVLAAGAASYALYLIHPSVVLTLQVLGETWPAVHPKGSLAAALLAVAVSLGFAFLLHYGFDEPVKRLLKRSLRVRRDPARGGVVAAASQPSAAS
ncbi:MAG TPA: acyltransferase [Beijerinckiaceae bacterium]|jgi:exopolysaccharide production protein ExoZ